MTLRTVPLLLLIAGLAAGCSSSPTDARTPADAAATEGGGRYEPSSAKEKKLLAELVDMKSDASGELGDSGLFVGPSYEAASGYECRKLTNSANPKASARLACGDGDKWFFAPDVSPTDPQEADSTTPDRKSAGAANDSPTESSIPAEGASSLATEAQPTDEVSDTAPPSDTASPSDTAPASEARSGTGD